MGKTRLAREVVAALGPGFAVEWTAATPASARIPFGAFSHLLPEPDAAVEDRLRLLRRTTALLRDRAAGKPLLLAVDDVQWLDPGAVALVHQLVVTDMARVLLTLRTGEQVTDPVVGLWKDGFVERLELQPLAPIDVETLVVAALGGPVERPTVRRFWELSGGNALFLRELVAGGTETGALACEDGIWRWRGTFQPSTRLATILEERLGRMSRAGRAVLDHLAVGEPLPLETLAALCDRHGIAEVERAGLVLVDQLSADVRLAHPLYADADGAGAASAEADEHVAGAAIFEGLVRRARGWVALARGQRSRAVELALDAATWSGAHAQHSAEMRSLHDAVRFGGGLEPAQKLATLAPRLEGAWARSLAVQATALVENDGKALEAAASQLEEMGALLLAAEAAAQASGAFRRAQLDSRAERTMSLARLLADRCERARSPILDDIERPLPLSSREREVAILAAEGLSSNVIADRLFVSTRTVEGHLYRVYAKLGVHDRRALGRLLHHSEDEPRQNQPAWRGVSEPRISEIHVR